MKFFSYIILILELFSCCTKIDDHMFLVKYDNNISFNISRHSKLIGYRIETDYRSDTIVYLSMEFQNDTIQAMLSILKNTSHIRSGNFEKNALLAFETQDQGKCRKEDFVKPLRQDLDFEDDKILSRTYTDYYIIHRYIDNILFSKIIYCKNHNCEQDLNELVKIRFNKNEW